MTEAAMADASAIQSILDSILASPGMITSNLTSSVQIEAGPTVISATSMTAPDDDERPDHSYMDLIVMALNSMPERQGTLHDIYRFISGKFPFYTKNRKHWKNSVRHNLALHKCFKRLDTDGENYLKPLLEGKKPKVCPLWSLLWDPAERPDLHNSRKRHGDKSKSSSKKRKGLSEEASKSSSAKKSKQTTVPSDNPLPASQTPTDDPLTRIAMMLPEIGSSDAVSSSPPSASSSLHRGLVQPPQTPESDYCSLSSDYSPYIPGQSLSAGSTCHSVSEYQEICIPSPRGQAAPGAQFPPLPLLSVEDICTVLQCNDLLPRSPDSGTGAEILEGFGWFDEPAPGDHQQQFTYEYHPQYPADSLFDNTMQNMDAPSFQPEPPAVCFLIPKVPVQRPLSVNTDFPW
ncbi:forkhead box protein C1-like [Acanthaster planci]|uniref:Forkhead box protein C1-like n=1 Tax=Acanthaster planci TaxID=133434 RepID=A0A8B7XUN8_ACAPL|nr:forkhead box protein C1-like [Acanthaster planci]